MAFGDVGDFVPTIIAPRGTLELNMASNLDESSSGNRVSRSSDLYATERLRLLTNGFIYHPRFIQFLFQAAGGFSQEKSTSTYAGDASETSLGTEYEFRTKFLPEHPYNLELYTLRKTPLLQGRATMETRTTTIEKGAIFLYKKRPFSLNLGYDETRLESKNSFDETKTASINGGFFTTHVNNSAGYTHTDSFASLGMNSTGDRSYFNNVISVRGASLSSNVGQYRQRQDTPFSDDRQTDQFIWKERFIAELPWHFSTTASYDLQKDKRMNQETSAESADTLKNDTTTANFTLSHRIYESVQTNYNLMETRTHSSSGDSTSLLNALDGTYIKKIPDGRVMIGAQGSHLITEQNSSLRVIGEIYHAAQFGTFTLAKDSIDPASLTIEAVSDSGVFVPLTLNSDYIAQPYGNTIRIMILSLPSAITAGHVPGDIYTFSVSYLTIAGSGTLAINTIGYSFNLKLFNNLLNPYYYNLHKRQTVLTGYLPGRAQDTKSNTVGLAVRRAPYELTSEYQSTESDAYPSRKQKNTMAYSRALNKTTSFNATLEHTVTNYGSGYLGSSGSTDKFTAINATLNSSIPEENMISTLMASYIQRHSSFDSDIYLVMGSLTWNRGSLSVNIGATLNESVSSGAFEKKTSLSQSFYLIVNRRLF